MVELDDHDLNETQSYIMQVLRSLVAILDELEIPYFMQGGTMLGAIRHKGFIPWDDDVDLGIPRKDYERLLKTISEKLPKNLQLRTYSDETDHHYYFARIVDTRYQIRRMGSLEERMENIWVDLFPLDGMPNGWAARTYHKLRLTWVRLKYHLSCFEKVNIKRPGRPLIERMVIRFAMITHVGKWFNTRRQLDKMDALLKSILLRVLIGWLISWVRLPIALMNCLKKKYMAMDKDIPSRICFWWDPIATMNI